MFVFIPFVIGHVNDYITQTFIMFSIMIIFIICRFILSLKKEVFSTIYDKNKGSKGLSFDFTNIEDEFEILLTVKKKVR